MCSTCSSRRIIPTISGIPAVRRFRRTTSPGWTLAHADGDRVRSRSGWLRRAVRESRRLRLSPPATRITRPANPAGYLISHRDQQFVHAGEPAAEGGQRGVLAEARRNHLGSGALPLRRAILEKGAAELGVPVAGVGARRRRGHDPAQAAPDRSVRSVRRPGALGLDSLAVRAVRVSV